MKAKELREKTEHELLTVVREGKEKMRKFRFALANRQLENVHEMRMVKKDIARAKTLLQERKNLA